jgi:hypothetical protein
MPTATSPTSSISSHLQLHGTCHKKPRVGARLCHNSLWDPLFPWIQALVAHIRLNGAATLAVVPFIIPATRETTPKALRLVEGAACFHSSQFPPCAPEWLRTAENRERASMKEYRPSSLPPLNMQDFLVSREDRVVWRSAASPLCVPGQVTTLLWTSVCQVS